jgi:protein-S-isoprenylcysteine O-methyltransferase Ste14
MNKRVFYMLGDFMSVLFFGMLALAAIEIWRRSNTLISLGILLMNSLILAVYVIRRKPDAIIEHPFAWIIGVAGTLLGLLYRPGQADVLPVLLFAGNAMQIVGLAATIGSLLSLRRSLGIIAANRGIKQGGLYRFIRHPLYASELVFFCGYVFSNQSAANLILLIMHIAAQYSRARIEENFLSSDPVYQLYLSKTRYRFLPGVL